MTQARAAATQIKLSAADLSDPAKLRAFEQAQGQLSQSLGRRLAVSERYPDLKANANFRDLRLTSGFGGRPELCNTRGSAFIKSLGLRPMDIGKLPMARTLEHVCLLSLGLVAHSVGHTNFSLGINLITHEE